MNKVNVELPDGRLVTIEGSNAPEVADFLASHYLGLSRVPIGNSTEEPLPLPTLTFEPPSASSRKESPKAELVTLDDEPLALPVLTFG